MSFAFNKLPNIAANLENSKPSICGKKHDILFQRVPLQ